MAEFHRTVTKESIPVGRCQRVEINGLGIGLFHLDDGVFAIDDMCTHAEASLCDGDIEGGEVLCPLHFATFDIRTGECTGPPADEDVRTYPVRISDDGVIEVEV